MSRRLDIPEVKRYADGRFGFDDYFSEGRLKKVRLRSRADAMQRAMDVAVFKEKGRKDLAEMSAHDVAEFMHWKRQRQSSITIGDAIESFLKLKTNKSGRYYKSLRGDLHTLRDFVGDETPVGTITASILQSFIDSRHAQDRRKFNLRASAVTLWRWMRRMGHIIDRTTEAELVEPIERKPGHVNILSLSELQKLLENVNEQFLPWLVIGAFAGVRTEEISPDHTSRKSPLMWEDFKWDKGFIDLRAATSKVGKRRLIPLQANLIQWLTPWRNAKGPVCPIQPTKHYTAQLGKVIGGWKHNCLRDSYASYRCAITRNVPALSYEMGNSIQMVMNSYHDTREESEARDYFSSAPDEATKTIFLKSSKKG